MINITDISDKPDQLGYIHSEAENALAMAELAATYSSWSTRCRLMAQYCFANMQREVQRLPHEQRAGNEVTNLLQSVRQQLATLMPVDGEGGAR